LPRLLSVVCLSVLHHIPETTWD